MKKKNDLLIFCFFFFGIVILPDIINMFFINSSGDVQAVADGFTIEAYNVKLDVKEDLKVDVIEEITVNWYEGNHHGIYKFTPEWYEYTGSDNKTIKRKSVISDYHAIGDNYTTDIVKKKPRIKIGDAFRYVELGNKTYTIAYTYDMGKDPFEGFDELIYHAYGDYWGTVINNASLEITLPKSIKTSDIKFFADKYRQKDVTEAMDIEVNGNKIIAKYNEQKASILGYSALNKSLTLDVLLPEGYFVGGSYNYTNWSLLLIIICLILTFITIKNWFKYGKDYPKRAQTVEFYAPDGLNSAEIGYISGNKNVKKLTISLIIGIASKGYIKIDEDEKKNIKITNLAIEPKKPNYLDSIPKRKVELGKKKEIDDNLSSEEKTFMKFLFKKGAYKELNSNFDKLDRLKESLVNNGYIEIISDNQIEIDNMTNNTLERHATEYRDYEQKLNEYNSFVSKLEPLNEYEKVVYNYLKDGGNEYNLKDNTSFYKAFDEINELLKDGIHKQINDQESASKVWPAIGRIFLVVILSFVAYRVTEDMDPRLSILYKVAFICIPVCIFFTILMTRKTKYGEEIKAKVDGFKNFLVKVEKEQLERLVSQNPSYFYNILPYTYVLGISKKWMNKFEDIYYPPMDMGSFDYSSDSSYYDFCNSVSYPTPSYSSSSSGCSSCGGGCSSCGGGCSSCGGGGSW